MKQEHWKAMVPIILAYVEGKTVQFNTTRGWEDYDDFVFNDKPERYRIKPEPKLRPWKPEEVPVGALIRFKKANFPHHILGRAMITGEIAGWITDSTLPNYGPNKYTLETAFNDYEHSVDGGKTWLLCGVSEEQP